MQQAAIAVLVVAMMAAIGLRTAPGDFVDVWRRPLGLVLAVLVNVVLVPLFVLGATSLVVVPAEVAVGLLVCGAAPGGPTGPLFAAQARGHLAAAVTAMVTLSLLSVLTAPVSIAWSLGVADAADARHLLVPMMRTLGLFQLLPLLAGMTLRRVRPVLAERLAPPANRLANVLLLVVIVALLVSKGRVLMEVGIAGIVIAAVLVPISMALGALIPGPSAERRSFAMVTGVRNISLALLVSAAYFPAPLTDAAILTFGLFCMLLPFAAARVLGRRAA